MVIKFINLLKRNNVYLSTRIKCHNNHTLALIESSPKVKIIAQVDTFNNSADLGLHISKTSIDEFIIIPLTENKFTTTDIIMANDAVICETENGNIFI